MAPASSPILPDGQLEQPCSAALTQGLPLASLGHHRDVGRGHHSGPTAENGRG